MKKILLWILKMFLGGMVKTEQSKETEKAKRERDAARLHAQTMEEGKELEKDIVKKQHEIEKRFEEEKKNRPADDPFGVDKWNEK